MLQYIAIRLRALPKTERGATAVEYGLLVALIAAVIVACRRSPSAARSRAASTPVNNKLHLTPCFRGLQASGAHRSLCAPERLTTGSRRADGEIAVATTRVQPPSSTPSSSR